MKNFLDKKETARKYATINIQGREAVVKGNIIEHTGWSENLKNRFNTAIVFDETSEAEVKERILNKIEQIEKKLGISIVLATRDFPLHSTILEGTFEADQNKTEEEASQKRDALFSKLAKNKTTTSIEHKLIGKEIEYKYILVDKGNILLTEIEIPEAILHAREELAEFYQIDGLKPLPMKNILHISLGRISKLPSDKIEQQRILKLYEKELVALRHEISRNPLQLKVAKLNYESAYDLLNK